MASVKLDLFRLARCTARPRYHAWETVLGTAYFWTTSPGRGFAQTAHPKPSSTAVVLSMRSTRTGESAFYWMVSNGGRCRAKHSSSLPL